ncbi:MAG: CpcT/CpeT family chromophore lyase [Phycisphaerales bacterium JB040]
MTLQTFRRTAALALTALSAGLCVAQDDATQPEAPAFEMPVHTPAWTSPEIARVGQMLTGSWTTSQDVPVFGSEGDSERVSVVMHVAPAPVEGMQNTLYVETARADFAHRPFRHAIFELFEYDGSIRLRTYEMALTEQTKDVFTGLWAQPGYFPDLSRSELIATMDVALTRDGAGFAGASPYAYPTGMGGAVEMTSRVELTADRFSTFNTGVGADGEQAWRANYNFIKGEPAADVSISDDGMVIVEYVNPGEVVVEDGDQLHIHYAGWTSDKNQFDASRPKGRPFLFIYPPGDRAIVGWGLGMEGISIGSHRRLIIPGHLGYGERGNPRAGIAGDETLYFEVECVHMDKPEPDPEPGAVTDPEAEGDDHEGHDHG